MLKELAKLQTQNRNYAHHVKKTRFFVKGKR